MLPPSEKGLRPRRADPTEDEIGRSGGIIASGRHGGSSRESGRRPTPPRPDPHQLRYRKMSTLAVDEGGTNSPPTTNTPRLPRKTTAVWPAREVLIEPADDQVPVAGS